MVLSVTESQQVKLAPRDWIWLIIVIVGAATANLGLIYSQSWSMYDRIDQLDEKWQERTVQMSTRIRNDIENVRMSIPPDWFRKMVEANESEIRALRKEVAELRKS